MSGIKEKLLIGLFWSSLIFGVPIYNSLSPAENKSDILKRENPKQYWTDKIKDLKKSQKEFSELLQTEYIELQKVKVTSKLNLAQQMIESGSNDLDAESRKSMAELFVLEQKQDVLDRVEIIKIYKEVLDDLKTEILTNEIELNKYR